jgi:hypothetical protein
MRANEFIVEGEIAKPTKRQRFASRGMHKFRDPNGLDRIYELNRIMMAVASTDGITMPNLDSEAWSGRFNTAHPYTDVESDMLKLAYKAVGSEMHDLNHGDDRSQELKNTNTLSTVKPFKGYKRK